MTRVQAVHTGRTDAIRQRRRPVSGTPKTDQYIFAPSQPNGAALNAPLALNPAQLQRGG